MTNAASGVDCDDGSAEADGGRAESTPLTDEHRRALESFVERHGYLSWLGLSVDHVERGHVEMSVAHDGRFVNPNPEGELRPVHGGIAATLVDTSSGFVLRTTFDDPGAAKLTTTDLDVSYLRPATGDLTVEADVVRAGRSTGVTDVTVESVTPDGERKAVAVGRATYRLFRERDERDADDEGRRNGEDDVHDGGDE